MESQLAAVLNWPTPAEGHSLQRVGDLAQTNWVTVTNQTNTAGAWN
jgi:hypothetical protein